MPTWTSNIPSQVKTYANTGAFPVTGSVKTIYIAEDTDIAYYWTGSAYQAISIQDLSGLVPYTGATTDVDLGNNDLNAEGIKIKGTAGNGHLNLKHQSSNPSAGGQETVIFAGSDGEPRFKNDGNAVEQLASREWVGLQGFQNTPIVVNANITAQNDTVYHVVANATFTDPTGVEGRGYVVVVRSATATIGGNTGGAGTINYRLFYSGSWTTYQFWNINQLTNVFVPQTRTINGLDLTANRTLTTANINDSTNKRYVTDAQSTVIGNTSGTNTGDETQSSILSKLGWFTYNRVAESTAVTGTTAETIIENITIPENTFVNGGIIRSYNNKFRKVGSSGTLAVRLYIGPTANNLTGATLVGSFTGIAANQSYAEMLRTFTATTSGILGFSATQSNAVDTGNSSAGRLSASIDWTVNQYFMITVQLGNSADSVSLIGASLKNF